MGLRHRRGEGFSAVLILALSVSCSSGNGPTPCGPGQNPPNDCPGTAPVPTLASIAPTSVTAGSGALTLTVTGTNFTSSSVVNWNAAARTTTFGSATQLTAAISASDVATAGTAQVTITTPAPGGGTSSAATFTISAAVPTQTVGIVHLISTDGSGVAGNGHSFDPAVSNDGRYVAFSSLATNLVASDTNAAPDTFLHDTCHGPSAPPGCVISTQRISVDDAGHQLTNGATVNNSIGSGNTISSDGRFVVFLAQAGDFLLNSTTVPTYTVEVFLRDTCTGQSSGCVPSTTLMSTDGAGGAANANARNATISRNGRVVTFICGASNLVPGPVGTEQLYARDTCFGAGSGCTPANYLVSATNAGLPANLGVRSATINADGRYAVFQTAASNLEANDTNARDDIFLRDTCIGASAGCTPSTTVVSPNQAGGNSQTNAYAAYASVSGDGRFAVFASTASDLVSASTGGTPQVFIRDTCIGASGACTPANTLLSAALDGTVANSDSSVNGFALISNTGRYAVFSSFADNLLPGVGAGACYAKDTCFGAPAGCTPQLKVVSVDAQGNVLLGAGNALGSDGVPAISADGHYAVFERHDQASNAIQAYLILTGY